jgi:diguanylate cyclase (GGDEF)-like protein
MSNNYDQWAGRDSIFRSKLSNLRSGPTKPQPVAAPKALTNERYLDQLAQEKIAVAPQRTQSLDELERLALVDETTELYNFRWFMKTLAYEMKRGERYKRYLSIALISVDGLANIRRQNGADTADFLMRSATTILKSCVRDVDIAAVHPDYGFIVLFPETSAAGITTVVERIRTRMRSQPIMFAMQNFQITASIGAATFPNHGRKPDELIGRATQSLQVAIERGGDRVCIL